MWQSDIKNRGFAILPSVFERNDMAALVKNLNEHKGLRSRAGLRRALALPSVAALAWDPRLLGLARKILGTKAFPYQATLFEKSPSANWLVAWHQDRALPLREKRDTPGWGPWSLKQGIIYCLAPTPALCQVLALRVHLDDSTKQNGPLRVLPGTHRIEARGLGASAGAAAEERVVCVAGATYRLLRGEFHRHTELSQDGGHDGALEDMWRYAIDAAGLEWIGNGDHDNGGSKEYTWWLVQKTALGRAQRACEQDRKMAALLGIDVDRTISITFVKRIPAPLDDPGDQIRRDLSRICHNSIRTLRSRRSAPAPARGCGHPRGLFTQHPFD